jgi:predicted GNAT family acetyltransferase
MRDSVARHRLDRLVLFTGEDNAPARRVYENVGFQPVGHFALMFDTRPGL